MTRVPDDELLSVYKVHGLVLATEIELPELATRRVTTGSQRDVHIRLGELERSKSLPPWPFSCIALPDGAAFLEVPEVAQYLVRGSREVIVAPFPNADLALVRAFLLGWVIALICHQRDALALHASAVVFGGRVVAFLGDAGAGKSTMAAHCVQAGGTLFADDLLRVSPKSGGQPHVFPGMPQLRLWRHALEGLGQISDGLVRDYWREDKFLVPVAAASIDRELPLARIYVLEQDQTTSEVMTERILGAAAATVLVTNSHGWIRSVDVVGRRAGHFMDCVMLANSVEVVRLTRRRDPTQLPRIAARIAAVSATR